jgi:RimJ/RimL family protein N-acetyltransferase
MRRSRKHATTCWPAALRLAIAPASGQGLIGSCALFDVVAQHRRATLGYLLAPAYWGQGLAREALRALLAYGVEVLGLQRIEAEVDPRNAASQALLLRLGFQREGLMQARWRVGDEARDVELWALPTRA